MTVTYTRTVLGWFNVTVGNNRYNIAPDVFRKFTGVSENAALGVAEISETDLEQLIEGAIAI